MGLQKELLRKLAPASMSKFDLTLKQSNSMKNVSLPTYEQLEQRAEEPTIPTHVASESNNNNGNSHSSIFINPFSSNRRNGHTSIIVNRSDLSSIPLTESNKSEAVWFFYWDKVLQTSRWSRIRVKKIENLRTSHRVILVTRSANNTCGTCMRTIFVLCCYFD